MIEILTGGFLVFLGVLVGAAINDRSKNDGSE